MFHTTLLQGINIAQEYEKSLFESKWKGQEQRVLLEPKCKEQRKYCKPRSKDRVTNLAQVKG